VGAARQIAKGKSRLERNWPQPMAWRMLALALQFLDAIAEALKVPIAGREKLNK
jgi:hypothetical protein